MNRYLPIHYYLLLVSLFVLSCGLDQNSNRLNQNVWSDTDLLDTLQRQTIGYFWEGAEPISGAACERIHLDNIYPSDDKTVVTSGGTGFGIMAIIVGIERGWIPRQSAVLHLSKLVNWLEKADRFHGAWPHWMHGENGKTKPFSRYDDGGDLVETAFLAQGFLAARQYFKNGNDEEQALAKKLDKLWQEIEWSWYTKGGEKVLYWHWSPENEWRMNFPVRGHNECLIMYVLAASSPTFPIDSLTFWDGYLRGGSIQTDRSYLGYNTVLDHYEKDSSPVGPLFWAHYSHLGLDPRDLVHPIGDFWALNQNHAKIHYEHAVRNPHGYRGYGENCWGLTSSYSMTGYAGHRPDMDLGVISPTAALSSFPYTPDESMKFLRYLYTEQDSLIGKYGPYDAFSLQSRWYLPRYLAIDQGPIPVMVENHRSGLLWDLFMSAPEIHTGLDKLGFKYRKRDPL